MASVKFLAEERLDFQEGFVMHAVSAPTKAPFPLLRKHPTSEILTKYLYQ